MTQYASTECPKCMATTSNQIQRPGASQYCTCRICHSLFRAEVDADGNFTGHNSLMIAATGAPLRPEQGTR